MNVKKTNKKEPLLYCDNELLGSHILCKVLLENLPSEHKENYLKYLQSLDEEKYESFMEWDKQNL